MAEEKKALAYIGYVIDRGIPFDGIQKAVDFFDGVGIIDLEVIAATAPYWFDRNATGEIVAVHANAVSMQAFVDYWKAQGAKVTEIDKAEADEIRGLLREGKSIPEQYLKQIVDTRKVAARAAKEPTPTQSTGSDKGFESPAKKGKGK